MAIADERAKNRDEQRINESVKRLYYAGPKAVGELSEALESTKRIHRRIAGDALNTMTQHLKWPEAYAFVLERLKRLPKTEEAGELLCAVAHEGIKDYPEILMYAADYAYCEDKALTIYVSGPHNRVDMRVCDYAAWIIQLISGEDFRIPEGYQDAGPDDTYLVCPAFRSDEAVAKARAWVQNNMERRRNGKRIMVMPEFLKKSR